MAMQNDYLKRGTWGRGGGISLKKMKLKFVYYNL